MWGGGILPIAQYTNAASLAHAPHCARFDVTTTKLLFSKFSHGYGVQLQGIIDTFDSAIDEWFWHL